MFTVSPADAFSWILPLSVEIDKKLLVSWLTLVVKPEFLGFGATTLKSAPILLVYL